MGEEIWSPRSARDSAPRLPRPQGRVFASPGVYIEKAPPPSGRVLGGELKGRPRPSIVRAGISLANEGAELLAKLHLRRKTADEWLILLSVWPLAAKVCPFARGSGREGTLRAGTPGTVSFPWAIQAELRLSLGVLSSVYP